MKFHVCTVLAVLVATGSAGETYEIIQTHSGPADRQEVKTFQVIQPQERGRDDNGQKVEFFKVFYPQSQENHIKFIPQRQLRSELQYVNLIREQHTEHAQEPLEHKTIEVLHKHPADHIKSIQIVHEQPITHADGNFGDAFETLKSLKVYGAFEGNGAVVDSYGSPIVGNWHLI